MLGIDRKHLETFLRVSAQAPAVPGAEETPLPRAITDRFQQWAAGTIKQLIKHTAKLEKSVAAKDLEIALLKSRLYKDSLTGAFNREYLHSTLATPANSNERRLVEGDQILYIDLSRFKEINDTYGHHVGDMGLQRTAEFLTSCVRDTDIVARVGGDEFVVVLLGADEQTANVKAQMIIEGFKTLTLQREGDTIPIRGNVGIYNIHSNDLSLEEMLNSADEKMYAVKTGAPDYKPRNTAPAAGRG